MSQLRTPIPLDGASGAGPSDPSDLSELQRLAEAALAALRAAGCDDAQVSASRSTMAELAIAHNHPSLMRSTRQGRLALVGIWDGRKASTDLPDAVAAEPAGLRLAVQALRRQAQAAPRDEANAVSSGQQGHYHHGPHQPDLAVLARAAEQLLAWRAEHHPGVMLEEAGARHHLDQQVLLTSRGSHLSASLGHLALEAMGTARAPATGDQPARASSFNYAGGRCETFDDGVPAAQRFGLAEMMDGLARSVDTCRLAQHFGGNLAGDVVLMPQAVESLLAWLHGQVGDVALLAGTSLFRDAVGQAIASPLLTLHSRFDGPGLAPISADGCAAAPVVLVDRGRLQTLTPTLYASRRLQLPHVPLAQGWALAPGHTPLAEMVQATARGALVGRLSMGQPAANGDFSGVIKNSFLIDQGRLGSALSETMVSGNVAQMLRDVVAVSAERLDTGLACLPWLRVTGLHFS